MSLDLAIKIRADGSTAGAQIRNLRNETEGFGAAARRASNDADLGMRNAGKATDTLTQQFARAKTQVVGLFTAMGAGAAATAIIRTVAEYEKLNAQLVTLAGSKDAAKAVFDDIREFAKTTPYELGEVTNTWILLKARGIDPTNASMRGLGNVAAAMGKNIVDVTNSALQASVGNLETMRMMGFDVQAQGDKLRVTFDGMTQTIGKDAASLVGYFQSIGNSKFGNAMDEQMQTLVGGLSNMGDALKDATVRFSGATGFTSAITDGANAVAGFLSGLDETATVKAFADAAKVAGAAVAGLLVARAVPAVMAAASRGMWTAVAAMRGIEGAAVGAMAKGRLLLAFFGGWPGIIAGAVTAIGAWLFSTHKSSEETENFTMKLAELRGEMGKVESERLKGEMEKTRQAIADINEEMSGKKGHEWYELMQKRAEAQKYLNEVTRRYQDSLHAVTEEKEKDKKATKDLTEAEQETLDRLLPVSAAHRRYREELDRLNEAKAKGKISTAEYKEALANLDAELAAATKKAEKMGSSFEAAQVAVSESAKRQANATSSVVSAAEDAWVEYAKTGKLSIESVAEAFLEQLARMVFQANAAAAASSLFGGLFRGFNFGTASTYGTDVGSQQTAMLAEQDAGLLHTGGMAGSTRTTRRVPSGIFAGAMRYHGGGTVLGPDEVPAVLLKGEEVLSRGDPRNSANGGGAGGVTVSQTFDFRGAGADAEARLRAASEDIKRETRNALVAEMNRRGPAAFASGRARR